MLTFDEMVEYFRSVGMSFSVATELASQIIDTLSPEASVSEVDARLEVLARREMGSERGGRDLMEERGERQLFLAQQGIDPLTGRRLPLGIEATRQEQLRQSIQRRFGTTDPERLAEISEQQALIASQGIRQRRFAEREADIQRVARERVGEPQTFAQLTAPTLAGLREEVSPAGQRFFERDLQRQFAAGGFAELERKHRERLVGAIVSKRRKGARGLREEEEEAEESLERLRQKGSPWQRFLETFRPKAREQFAALTARERGFQSGQFRPRTRFLR